jgi:two-component system response regulator AtoC
VRTLSGSILVVDDDADIRDILSETLHSLGCRVITAANGQECLDKVDKEAPELVLLDIEMPVKNGLEVLIELRQRARGTTALMITAYGTIERAVQAMKEGAFDFITKPFDLDHIAMVVEKALERERLKRGLERFTEEAGERYRLVGGESQLKRRPPADPRFYSSAKVVRGKKSLPEPFITGAKESMSRLSRLIV